MAMGDRGTRSSGLRPGLSNKNTFVLGASIRPTAQLRSIQAQQATAAGDGPLR